MQKIVFVPLLFLSLFTHSQGDGYVRDLLEQVQDPSRQTGNLHADSVATLPIGLTRVIGNKKYIIAIDSAKFKTEGATFSAYMGVRIPGSDRDLLFAARNIGFNPAGVKVTHQSRLQLIADQTINLGPHIQMNLPGDGSNFVEWDCNGFQSLQIHGEFRFSSNIILPADPADSMVTAQFQTRIYDLHNIITQITFNPFTINGMQDVKFQVNSAVVDLSDYANPQNLNVPSHYLETIHSAGNLWRGFYLQEIRVTLPEKFDRSTGPVTFSAHDMVIDNAGVTGRFQVENIISLDEGEMVRWPFSVERIDATIAMNELIGGSMEGKIKVSALKNKTIDYTAQLMKNSTTQQLDYAFSITPPDTSSFDAFGASLNIHPSSHLIVESSQHGFRPRLVLNGNITVDQEYFTLDQIAFEQLTLEPEAPYITGGIFSLVSTDENNISRFPVQLDMLRIAFSPVDDPVLDVFASLNLGDESNNSISVSSGVQVTAGVEEDYLDKLQWSVKEIRVKRIDIDVSTSALNMNGSIFHFKEDSIIGDGFGGSIAIEIPDVVDQVVVDGVFGHINGYRYWKADAAIPVNWDIGNLTITRLNGGASNHMEGIKTPEQLINGIAQGASIRQEYMPNQNAGLEFRAGIGFLYRKDKLLNGDALLAVGFNSYGGLAHIQFTGEAYMMVERSERRNASNWIRGSITIDYDNNNRVFDAFLDVTANFSNKITGNAWSKIYVSPELWFVHIGKPSNRCHFNLLGFASVDGYFMAGQELEPMPSPPVYITSALGGISSQRDTESISSGDGFATGMSFDIGFDGDIGLGDAIEAYWHGYVGAGFDMTLFKYPESAYCEGGPQDFGMNNWYLEGQLYTYINIGVGISGRVLGQDFDVLIFDSEVAALIQGQGPNPTYARTQLQMNATILSVLEFSFPAEVELGNQCQIRS